MQRIAGDTVIEHVMRRAGAIPGIAEVCLATTDRPEDDAVAAEGRRLGVTVHRGSADDVLARYAGAARVTRADIVLRITCDCPLLDPAVCGQVLRLRDRTGADYAANMLERTWPVGLDCEACTRAMLDRADAEATDAYDREHVTPWVDRHAKTRANLPCPDGNLSDRRWTLDYPEDLEFFRALAPHLPPPPAIAGWREIAAVLDRHPEIAAINVQRRARA
jgi:spore coat polysaccharide biosynthesis protein SpsF